MNWQFNYFALLDTQKELFIASIILIEYFFVTGIYDIVYFFIPMAGTVLYICIVAQYIDWILRPKIQTDNKYSNVALVLFAHNLSPSGIPYEKCRAQSTSQNYSIQKNGM